MKILDLKNEIIEILKNNVEKKYILKKDSKIFTQGIPIKNFKIILSGTIQVTYSNNDGKEIILGLFKNPSIIIPGLEKTNSITTLFSGIVVDECKVWEISKTSLKHIIYNNPKLAFKFIDYNDLLSKMLFINMKSVFLINKKYALLELLIRFYRTYGSICTHEIIINKKLSNKSLAKYINVATETVSRIISELKKENIISVNAGYFKIIDLDFCENILGCMYCDKDLCGFVY